MSANLADQMKQVATEKHREFVKEQTKEIMIVLLRSIRDAADHGKFSVEYGGMYINDPSVRGSVRERLIEDGFTVEWNHDREFIVVGWAHPKK